MDFNDVMATLKKAGSAQTAKTYRRHGARGDLFGVKFGDHSKLVKKIKTDHALASELWTTGNADARTLALMIADPARLTPDEASRFADQADWAMYAFYLSCLVGRSPIAAATMKEWMKSQREFHRACGYDILSARLKENPAAVADADCEKALATIEREIHGSPNRARYSMNNAVIAIGVYKPSLRKQAVDAAKRIGKVEVDHGDTACKTPDAVAYIAKGAKRRC